MNKELAKEFNEKNEKKNLDKMLKVQIRLNQNRLAKIQGKPKAMYLGSQLIEQHFLNMEIPKKLLVSDQCKHWMEVDDWDEYKDVEEEVEEVNLSEEVVEIDADEILDEENEEDQ